MAETYQEGWDKFKAEVKEYYPEYYHTLEWNEHPEGYNDPCFCATCRSYMTDDDCRRGSKGKREVS